MSSDATRHGSLPGPEVQQCPYAFYHQLREYCPCVPTPSSACGWKNRGVDPRGAERPSDLRGTP